MLDFVIVRTPNQQSLLSIYATIIVPTVPRLRATLRQVPTGNNRMHGVRSGFDSSEISFFASVFPAVEHLEAIQMRFERNDPVVLQPSKDDAGSNPYFGGKGFDIRG